MYFLGYFVYGEARSFLFLFICLTSLIVKPTCISVPSSYFGITTPSRSCNINLCVHIVVLSSGRKNASASFVWLSAMIEMNSSSTFAQTSMCFSIVLPSRMRTTFLDLVRLTYVFRVLMYYSNSLPEFYFHCCNCRLFENA